jgi:ComF family protein
LIESTIDSLPQRPQIKYHVDGYNLLVFLPQIIRDVVDFVYPGRCAACAADCNGGDFLCHGCSAGLDHLATETACARCAGPVVSTGAPCPWCRGEGIYPFDGIVRLGKFADPLREIIHAMKYRRRWPLAQSLADRLMTVDRVTNLLSQADVVIPVPLHWTRHISRDYNQSEVLANQLARRTNLPLVRAVKRIRATPSQMAIHSRTVREENVRGAFSVRKSRQITGKRVVFVDDVMTTGATLQAAARALKQAKPASISAIVLAVADPKGQNFQSI